MSELAEYKRIASRNNRNCRSENPKRISHSRGRLRERQTIHGIYDSQKKEKQVSEWKVNRIFLPRQILSIEERFFYLAKKWKRETAMSSLVIDKITNENYMNLIGMGILYKDKIVRLILRDLQISEEFWHYALKSITNENPVPNGVVNNLSIVREYWLKWGRENNKL